MCFGHVSSAAFLNSLPRMTSLLVVKIYFFGFILLLCERRSDAYPFERYSDGSPGEFYGSEEGREGFADSYQQMGDGDGFVLINDNRMVNFNYHNDVSEVYLDGTSIGGREKPPYQYDGVDHIPEGPAPTFEREDVDGEDVERLREVGSVHLMPLNGRIPSGIEDDVDGLDYVAHDPRDLETLAHAHGQTGSAGSVTLEDAEMKQYGFEDSWGI